MKESNFDFSRDVLFVFIILGHAFPASCSFIHLFLPFCFLQLFDIKLWSSLINLKKRSYLLY